MKNSTFYHAADAVLLSSPSTLFYLSGVANSDAIMLIVGRERIYITDRRYEEMAYKRLKDIRIEITCQGESYLKRAIAIARDNGVHSLAIEETHLVAKDYIELTAVFDDIKYISSDIIAARRAKTTQEIARVTAAQHITDVVFFELLDYIKAGVSERDCAHFIQQRYAKYGATPAFDTIVAFSENASLPHAVPTDRELRAGDSILIDCGAKLEGYCSDMTRTFCYKECSEQFERIYNIVLATQEEALRAINPGVLCADVDMVARKVFEDAGYLDNFKHSLGHGVGIDIHEAPYLSPTSLDTLAVGDVVTVEPGLYLDNNIGVRIEDMVFLTEIASENLTKAPKQLIIVK